jgi:hypothetical protein
MDVNPYESPRAESLPFSPIGPSTADLERRVAELERIVAQTWFMRPSFVTKTIAVWAYFFLGYAMMAAVIMPLMFFFDWLTSR